MGSGLAVSALTSAIMPELVQPDEQYEQTWYWNQGSLLAINVFLHSAIGFVTAIIIALMFRSAIERFWKFSGDRIRKR
ncbi:hypothetical protein [Myxosarcina sp. GI1(2024)]